MCHKSINYDKYLIKITDFTILLSLFKNKRPKDLSIVFVVCTYRLKNNLKDSGGLDVFELLNFSVYVKVYSGISKA